MPSSSVKWSRCVWTPLRGKQCFSSHKLLVSHCDLTPVLFAMTRETSEELRWHSWSEDRFSGHSGTQNK